MGDFIKNTNEKKEVVGRTFYDLIHYLFEKFNGWVILIIFIIIHGIILFISHYNTQPNCNVTLYGINIYKKSSSGWIDPWE
ncbi:MAG: hypothetical protein OMM_09554 [Candidatus Magnetoglobus multicellularis str. Araruama]|uniref:Uncharacterized protein n=1 Tax=Candidatus Magnetoglobus multicellularis str. Araruama TaxID=890399 RepID=A0A1V1P3W9_9BACT|nr:MAG: hypothetical protein OMM_09554 [Candidatus Magnetoglobus multicellularis str. Araruama]